MGDYIFLILLLVLTIVNGILYKKTKILLSNEEAENVNITAFKEFFKRMYLNQGAIGAIPIPFFYVNSNLRNVK